MADESFEVPIMLSPDRKLSFEDISKLNPFYDELRSFWNNSPEVGAMSASSRTASSNHSLFQSDYSAADTSSWSSGPSMSSIEHPIQPSKQPCALAKSRSALNRNMHKNNYSYDSNSTSSFGRSFSPRRAHDCRQSSSPITQRPCSYYGPDLSQLSNCHIQRQRSSHKKLFGENGWLGSRADVERPLSDKTKTKVLKDIGKKLKKHVEGFAVDVVKAHPIQLHQESHSPRIVEKTTIPISLDSLAQAKLYSDIEVMICVSANRFLVQQHYEGRLSTESIRKITNFWGSKNRPQVVEFQFDQATQRQLILMNIQTLNFNGECSTNPILLHSNLQNWKAIAKEMSVRTFCAPDSAVRKHLHDIQKILDMLGAPLDTFLAFQEIQVRTLAVMKEKLVREQLADNQRGCGPHRARLLTSMSR